MPQSNIETKLEEQITTALEKLTTLEPESKEYGVIVDHITKLHKLKSEEHTEEEKPERIKPPSMDTVLVVGANIFGILWLARYEKENVIRAQKAFGLVMRPR